jgi:hypothetical protein
MFKAVSILVLCAGIAGCASVTTGGTAEQRAIAVFRQICAAEPLAHAAFLTLAAGRVGQSVVNAEARAHFIVAQTCASQPTDWQTAAAAAAKAFSDVLTAQNYAERVAGVDRAAVVVVTP